MSLFLLGLLDPIRMRFTSANECPGFGLAVAQVEVCGHESREPGLSPRALRSHEVMLFKKIRTSPVPSDLGS